MNMDMKYKAVNWDLQEDPFSLIYWNQNLTQMWTDDEFSPSKDLNTWNTLTPEEKDAYIKVLGGLTLLDTKQGNDGMTNIAIHTPNLQQKAVFSFMGMMENIHAKSYSTIFTTIQTSSQIEEIFKWVESNDMLKKKVDMVLKYYYNIHDKKSYYMALVASVFLESYLFFSGFYYPLYLAGQGKMKASGEIISMILRDEAVHGSFTGMVAKQLYEQLTDKEQTMVDKETINLLLALYEVEDKYTDYIYKPLGLEKDVKNYVQYNGNKALMNLGKEPYFQHDDFSQIVLSGISTESKAHDFFSQKGSSYIKPTNVEHLSDEDFIF